MGLDGVLKKLSLLAWPLVFRSFSASFLMVRNWNWIPSGVDCPKYLAISRSQKLVISYI